MATCQAQKAKAYLDSEPPKHRISVAYFEGAHPSDLLPFTSALLVACSGDTGKFAGLCNESLPALLAMDEAHGGFEAAATGKHKHAAWQSAWACTLPAAQPHKCVHNLNSFLMQSVTQIG